MEYLINGFRYSVISLIVGPKLLRNHENNHEDVGKEQDENSQVQDESLSVLGARNTIYEFFTLFQVVRYIFIFVVDPSDDVSLPSKVLVGSLHNHIGLFALSLDVDKFIFHLVELPSAANEFVSHAFIETFLGVLLLFES